MVDLVLIDVFSLQVVDPSSSKKVFGNPFKLLCGEYLVKWEYGGLANLKLAFFTYPRDTGGMPSPRLLSGEICPSP